MKPTRTCVLALALFATAGIAAAQQQPGQMQQPGQQPGQMQQPGQQMGQQQGQQGKLNLSAAKGNSITQALSEVTPQQVPGFQGQMGSRAPDAANPRPLPSQAASQVPEAKDLLFVKLPDRIVLIDPDTKMVAEIIMDTGGATTTGSGSPSGMSPSGQSPSGTSPSPGQPSR
jgi:hypothetical protein